MKITSAEMLANHLRDLRKTSDQSQVAVAERVGIKQVTLSAFETNPSGTKLGTLFKLLSALNLELHVLPRDTDLSKREEWDREW